MAKCRHLYLCGLLLKSILSNASGTHAVPALESVATTAQLTRV